jgi:hypothetical protein
MKGRAFFGTPVLRKHIPELHNTVRLRHTLLEQTAYGKVTLNVGSSVLSEAMSKHKLLSFQSMDCSCLAIWVWAPCRLDAGVSEEPSAYFKIKEVPNSTSVYEKCGQLN